MPLRVDYDAIANAYDWRYQHTDFSGIESAVTALVDPKPGARAVEVGCGTGRWLRLLRASGMDAAGVDASFGMLSLAASPVVQACAEQLPWISSSKVGGDFKSAAWRRHGPSRSSDSVQNERPGIHRGTPMTR